MEFDKFPLVRDNYLLLMNNTSESREGKKRLSRVYSSLDSTVYCSRLGGCPPFPHASEEDIVDKDNRVVSHRWGLYSFNKCDISDNVINFHRSIS